MSTLLAAIVAWFLIGALPRMRADAAEKLPAARQAARAKMMSHSATARDAKRRKGAEWYGWTTAALAAETAAVFGYMGRSAWRGWGDHRNRAKELIKANRARRANRATADGTVGGSTVPPDGGTVPPGTDPTVPPDSPGGGNRATPLDGTVPPGTVPEAVPVPVPSPDENGSVLMPFRRPDLRAVPAHNGGNMTMTAEAANLEMAVQVAERLIADNLREHDAAAAELSSAKAAQAQMESYGSQLASAGVAGGTMDALAQYADATEARISSATARVAGADASLAAARAAREELRKHESAADSLAATGGAAKETAWYGAGQAASGGSAAPSPGGTSVWDYAENQ